VIQGKRAVSPLIATVLLIAFAVALGAVVMNWGSAYVETTQTATTARYQADVGCNQEVQFNIISISGLPQLCNTSTSINFTIENGPYIDIAAMQLYVIGENAVMKQTLENFSMAKGDITRTGVAYDLATNGTIQQIRFIPIIEVGDRRSVCTQRQKTIDRIRSC